jgi:hypothetical protein
MTNALTLMDKVITPPLLISQALVKIDLWRSSCCGVFASLIKQLRQSGSLDYIRPSLRGPFSPSLA